MAMSRKLSVWANHIMITAVFLFVGLATRNSLNRLRAQRRVSKSAQLS